jgi:UDP-glucose 4-epimerase
MKFFVTGGAGYVGSHFVKTASDAGHTCLVFDNLERGHREAVDARAQLIVGDTRRREEIVAALQGFEPDVVLHYAAYALVAESVKDPVMYFENNVGGLENLIDAMKQAKCLVPLVFSSTCAVFGTPTKLPMSEDDPKKPESPYGESKLKAEQLLARKVKEYGFAAMALRYFNACGADASGTIGEDHDPETHLIPNLLKAVSGNQAVSVFGNDYPTPDGSCIRDYIHVTDLAESHLLAAKYLRSLGTVSLFDATHIGSGTGYSNLEIVKEVEKTVKQKVQIITAPRRPGDPAQLYADNSKAKKLLGFTPKHSSMENIIKTAWKWQQTRSLRHCE